MNPSETTLCGGGTSVMVRSNDPASPPAWCDANLGSSDVELCARAMNGSAQTYKVCDAAGVQTERAERITYQWYATAGTFTASEGGDRQEAGNEVGHLVTFHPPASGPFTL